MGHTLRNAVERLLSTLDPLKPTEIEEKGLQRFKESQSNTEELDKHQSG